MSDKKTRGRALAGTSGQTTVEAAFCIPLLFLLLLLLVQPMIMLYNHMIMQNAAAEGCRLLATKTTAGAYSQDKYEGYIKRRLAAIPPVDVFHAHTNGRDWEITTDGDETSRVVTVRVVNRLAPLPLLGWAAGLVGMCDEEGLIVQEVEVSMPTQPSWVWDNSGGGPQEWTTQWD
ncbi:MAG: pilus assembly protein [Coriobacteriales bacterium]|jgi:hypothetical protein|nr:pilus assembly protein [Coriobacteriales bacterium]